MKHFAVPEFETIMTVPSMNLWIHSWESKAKMSKQADGWGQIPVLPPCRAAPVSNSTSAQLGWWESRAPKEFRDNIFNFSPQFILPWWRHPLVSRCLQSAPDVLVMDGSGLSAGYLRHQIISTVITIISEPYRSDLPQNPDHAVQYSTIHCLPVLLSLPDLSTNLREALQCLEKPLQGL